MVTCVDFLGYSKIFHFQVKFDTVEFPAVTFCNLNSIVKSKAKLGGEQLVNVLAEVELAQEQATTGQTGLVKNRRKRGIRVNGNVDEVHERQQKMIEMGEKKVTEDIRERKTGVSDDGNMEGEDNSEISWKMIGTGEKKVVEENMLRRKKRTTDMHYVVAEETEKKVQGKKKNDSYSLKHNVKESMDGRVEIGDVQDIAIAVDHTSSTDNEVYAIGGLEEDVGWDIVVNSQRVDAEPDKLLVDKGMFLSVTNQTVSHHRVKREGK